MWRELCKNDILKKIPLVSVEFEPFIALQSNLCISRLFLNKCDLLRRKIESGVRLARFMTSYGERENDYETILRYFKSKFDAIRKQHSKDGDRESYVYATSVTVRYSARQLPPAPDPFPTRRLTTFGHRTHKRHML